MRITFVSNYINHHQIPFCDAMNRLAEQAGDCFVFVQTMPMEQERIRMGWQLAQMPEYVHCFYEEEDLCRKWILDSEVVLFGGCDDESYIGERLRRRRPIIRISERLYKTGQWKAVSPRGLRKKYMDHTRYRKAPVYLLCAGGYVPSDFHLIRAYAGRMFCWGYFPETRHYEPESLLEGKGYREENGDRVPYLLWAGRMIDWKHPELALETAAYLKAQGLSFHMDVIGGGDMEDAMRELWRRYGLEKQVSFLGFQTPQQVRGYMERADIQLFTSDRQEGWGAVANEAMNSGCALVADHMIGAVPYLIRHGENGMVYRDGDRQELFCRAAELVRDPALRRRLGLAAYRTITERWNAEGAAERMRALCRELLLVDPAKWCSEEPPVGALSPCDPTPVIPERKMFSYIIGGKRTRRDTR